MAFLAKIVDGVIVHRFPLDREVHGIGRHHDNVISIDDISVSGNHAEIEVRDSEYLEGVEEYFIKDLGSTNGTFVNGNPVPDEGIKMNNGDKVKVGTHDFKFHCEETADQTAHLLDGGTTTP